MEHPVYPAAIFSSTVTNLLYNMGRNRITSTKEKWEQTWLQNTNQTKTLIIYLIFFWLVG
jgi:hypothetical protein